MKSAFTYGFFFFSIFNLFFLENISRGGQTSNAFIEISLVAAIIIILLYLIIKRLLKSSDLLNNIFAQAVLLFLLSELVIFCFTGEICLFGLTNRLSPDSGVSSDVIQGRLQLKYSFSMSFLIADVLFIVLKASYKRLAKISL